MIRKMKFKNVKLIRVIRINSSIFMSIRNVQFEKDGTSNHRDERYVKIRCSVKNIYT